MSYRSSYKPTYGTETLEDRHKLYYNPDNKEYADRYGPNAWKWLWLADDNIAFQPPEECLKAVRVHHQALEFVRNKTYEICMEAVRYYEICMEAVRYHGHAIVYVPSKMRTYEMALLAAHNGAGYEVLEHYYSQTHELVLACVKNDFRAISLVKSEFMTMELCITAVENDYRAFDYISADFLKRFLAGSYAEDKMLLIIRLISSCDQRKTTPNTYEKCGGSRYPTNKRDMLLQYVLSDIPNQGVSSSPKRVHLTS